MCALGIDQLARFHRNIQGHGYGAGTCPLNPFPVNQDVRTAPARSCALASVAPALQGADRLWAHGKGKCGSPASGIVPRTCSTQGQRYHRAVLDADEDALYIEFDPPDQDRVYRNYLETCRRRAGVARARAGLDGGVERSAIGSRDADYALAPAQRGRARTRGRGRAAIAPPKDQADAGQTPDTKRDGKYENRVHGLCVQQIHATPGECWRPSVTF
jgi:hypothetical protein